MSLSKQLVGTKIQIYVVVAFGKFPYKRFNVQWVVNGSALPVNVTADGQNLYVAPYALKAGLRHIATATISTVGSRSAPSMFLGAASFVVAPVPLPRITCNVLSNDDTTTTVTALSTSIRISVTMTGDSSSAPSAFRFGYIVP